MFGQHPENFPRKILLRVLNKVRREQEGWSSVGDDGFCSDGQLRHFDVVSRSFTMCESVFFRNVTTGPDGKYGCQKFV